MKKIIILLLAIMLFVNSCGGSRTAVIDTSMGTIEIQLFTREMPITTKNFIDLAEEGFYEDTKFHRVIKQFMIQGGDPLSKDDTKKQIWGTGGPGYTIEDEFAEGLSNAMGTIAMANAGPNTGGSQFFINLVSNTFLDSKHPVFGKVVKGMDVVERIGQVETVNDKPVKPVIIEKITIKS